MNHNLTKSALMICLSMALISSEVKAEDMPKSIQKVGITVIKASGSIQGTIVNGDASAQTKSEYFDAAAGDLMRSSTSCFRYLKGVLAKIDEVPEIRTLRRANWNIMMDFRSNVDLVCELDMTIHRPRKNQGEQDADLFVFKVNSNDELTAHYALSTLRFRIRSQFGFDQPKISATSDQKLLDAAAAQELFKK